jgi:arylformamidase
MSDAVRPWLGESTPEALDAEYNLRTRHPEREAVYAGYTERSELLRSTIPVDLDVSYGPHERSVLDLFPVSGAQAILVFFHGGYWRALDKSIFSFVAAPFVEAGYAVAIPNYPLAPETPIGGIVDQALAAVTWIGKNRDRLGARGDTPITVAGHSAGGHLSAICAATDWTDHDLESNLISGCVPISGLFELEHLRHTNVAAQVHMTADEARRLSPIHRPRAGVVPTLLVVGGDETDGFVWQSRAYQDYLAQTGTTAELCEEPGFNHFTILEPFADPDHALHQRVKRLLAG